VTIASTPVEARAAFRELALLAHPDKGGSEADMRALLHAYRFVDRQLSNTSASKARGDAEGRTGGELLATFEAFCREQVVDEGLRPEWLRELLGGEEEARTRRFNEMFAAAVAGAGAEDAEDTASVECAGAGEDVVEGAEESGDANAAAATAEASEALEGGEAPSVSIRRKNAGYGHLMAKSEYARLDGTATLPVYVCSCDPIAPPGAVGGGGGSGGSEPVPFSHAVSTYVRNVVGARPVSSFATDYTEAFDTAEAFPAQADVDAASAALVDKRDVAALWEQEVQKRREILNQRDFY
jgi:hypothetical protein